MHLANAYTGGNEHMTAINAVPTKVHQDTLDHRESQRTFLAVQLHLNGLPRT